MLETRIRALFTITVLFLLITLTTYWLNSGVFPPSNAWLSESSVNLNSEVSPHNSERPSESSSGVSTRNVFYNRVPKCGSRSLTNVARGLSTARNFTVKTSDIYNANLTKEAFREEIFKIGNLPPRTLYQKHLHFVDFRKDGYEQPIYINLIRDPAARYISMHNYRKYGSQDVVRAKFYAYPDIEECIMTDHPECTEPIKLSVMLRYFCGVEKLCKDNIEVDKMVELAKKHLDEEYLLVGLTEEFDNSLRLLEKMLPDYFAGALRWWDKHRFAENKTATNKRDDITEEATAKLRAKLAGDYAVYDFAKKKFQYLKIKYGIA